MEREVDDMCKDIEDYHGRLLKMECIHPWSSETYFEAISPFTLSGWYKLTYEDGAEVEIAGVFSYILVRGSFGLIRDHSGKVKGCSYVRDTRALAHIAQMGASLKRETLGECSIPESVEEAERILWGEGGLGVPYEAVKTEGETFCRNMVRWLEIWKNSGLIRLDDNRKRWLLAH